MFRCASCLTNKFISYRYISGFALIQCVKCGLLQTKTSESERFKYVQKKYSVRYAQEYKNAWSKLNQRFARHMALIERYSSGKKLLDIGCGTGYFLKYLTKQYSSWSVFGVEPSNILRKEAIKNTGLEIRDGELCNIPFKDNCFDVVTCYDVLEHDARLAKNIDELKRVLKPGGLLFVQAPNYKSIMAMITGNYWDWWCIPDHVLHFSYLYLIKYLKTNGFTIQESYTYEDRLDYMSNIKGKFSSNYLLKLIYIFLIPLFLISEWIGWLTNRGGLIVVVARK